jgi:hypothetical protein
MCLSCGCGMPNDDHGDPRNITMDDLKAAADAVGIEAEDAVANIVEGVEEETDKFGDKDFEENYEE